jgi:hypothetical protein
VPVKLEEDPLAVTGIIGERRGTGSAKVIQGGGREELDRRIPEGLPQESTKKFVEVNTGEVLYFVKGTNEILYQKELGDAS